MAPSRSAGRTTEPARNSLTSPTRPATVADVGNEPTSGLIRVEFTLAPAPDSPIVVEHGLPGSAEVEVERVSPAVLVLRAAGQFLAARRTSERSEAGPP